MLLDPETESDVAYELCQLLGRAILPIGAGEGDVGTAFFLGGPGGDGYLLTAAALTHSPTAALGLRPSVTEPAGVAGDSFDLTGAAWVRPVDLGVAFLPTGGLHDRAAGQGWRWRTQQVPDAVAADADAIAGIGAEPGSAIVLALGVGADGTRPLEVAIERVVRDGDGVRVIAELPAGYVGAPVFGVRDDGGEVGLSCLGLVLPGRDGGHPVATFDRIRAALG
ncbi:hypothetical protein [Micromonospora endolithica]|uniref:Uncharacterized protein n=1 Tax=Micromonospora endolithica TaxID=230091 RepID=A0A3A9Z1N9_9ACTN|nr:hypothetical protein [Micromonospora endolithica]RKN42095.1 hypothetical protein D7223_23445 [Micromonospora endolithica]TWJ19919.1 hypothetical protein JD76_00005 [Micromonospora endolithica]TWJ26341.1 hypothetical protein JD76_06523 [Micromonospora endolithica]